MTNMMQVPPIVATETTHPSPVINERIAVTARRHSVFPKTFFWRGQRFDIRRIEKAWTVATPAWHGHAQRYCFRVHTGSAVCELYQELDGDTWYIGNLQMVH